MSFQLTIRRAGSEDSGTSEYVYEYDKAEVLIGRDEAVDVRLPHPTISLVHLRLLRKKGKLLAIDLGSTNGAYLDGVRLCPEAEYELSSRSVLSLGPFEISLGVAQAARPPRGPTAPEDTARYARQMVLEMLGAMGALQAPSFEVKTGPQRGQKLALDLSAPVRVGRGEDCALRLEDADASRHHLEVWREGDAVLVRDLGSKNGLVVNGGRHASATPRRLRDSDELQVGRTVLRFADPTEQYLRNLADAPAVPSPAKQPRAAVESGAGPAAEPASPSTAASALAPAEAASAPGAMPAAPAAGELPPGKDASALVVAVVAGTVLIGAALGLIYWLI